MIVLEGCRVRFRDCMLTDHYLNITCTRCIWIIVITTCISEIDRSNCAFRVQTEGRHATWNRLRRRPCQKRNVRHLDCPLCSLRVNSWLPWDHHIVLVTTCVLWVHDRCPFRHRDVFVGLFGQAENDLPPCNQRYNCCRHKSNNTRTIYYY